MNKGEELKALQAKQTLARSNITKCQTRMNEIEEELEKSKDLIRSQAELRRNIQQNLDYREAKAQLDELTREIESLEDSVLKIGGVSKFESLLLKNSQERDSLLKEVWFPHSCVEDYSVSFLFQLLSANQDLWKQSKYGWCIHRGLMCRYKSIT